MGRYITGDFEWKFWFACQPSDDILEYGTEREGTISVKKNNNSRRIKRGT